MAVEIRRDWERDGYVVLPGLIPGALCDAAREAFAGEIKPHRGHLYRQASANPERHVFSEHGYVLNSLLNIQDLPRKQFPRFRAAGMAVLAQEGLRRAREWSVAEVETFAAFVSSLNRCRY